MGLNSRTDYLVAILSIVFAQLMLVTSMGLMLVVGVYFEAELEAYVQYPHLLLMGYFLINGAAVSLLGRLHVKLKRTGHLGHGEHPTGSTQDA